MRVPIGSTSWSVYDRLSFTPDGHRIELGGDPETSIPPKHAFDGTPRTLSRK
jgi:hypothetical protein